jgi:predicted nucleic acid-binding protein
MVKYLLDTNVIAELVKPIPNPAVVAWVDAHDEHELYISVVTIGELLRGIAKHPHPVRQVQLAAWVHDELVPRFGSRIWPVSLDVMRAWAQITVTCERAGRPLPAMDSLLTATALHHGATLVTRNTRDFAQTGIPLHNPWE